MALAANNNDMIDVQAHNQLPSALIPPTSLHLNNIHVNRERPERKESLALSNRAILTTPKQQYSVFNLLPHGNNQHAFDGLGRIRDQMRRDSQEYENNEGTDAADTAQIGRESLNPGLDYVENLNRI